MSDDDSLYPTAVMLTLRPSGCGITMGKKESLRSLLLRAWRERWDEQVWGIAIKQVSQHSCHPVLSCDQLIDSLTVAPS